VASELPVLEYDVSATTIVLGALASRDWRPMHHDYDFAVNRNGTKDIFMNTPNLAAWFERYITDWTGPKGRLGRITFRIRDSIFPGNRMKFAGTITDDSVDSTGCRWVSLEIDLHADDRLACTCTARVAVPANDNDNPWQRRGKDWTP